MRENKSNRLTRIAVRLTTEEKEFIQRKAKIANKSISEYCRDTLIAGVVIKLDTSKTIEVLNALNRIGNNVNQIAKAIHSHGDYVSKDDCRALREEFEMIRSSIIEKIYHETFDYHKLLNEAKFNLPDVYVEEEISDEDLIGDVVGDEELDDIDFEYIVGLETPDIEKNDESDDFDLEDFKKLLEEEFGD